MGTKSTDNGLSDQNVNNDSTNSSLDDFESIAEALSSKDFDNLGRLMSAKDEENKEAPKQDDEEDEEEDSVTNEGSDLEGKDGDDDSQDEPDEDESNEKEAAESAASKPGNKDEDLQAELHRLRSDAGRVPFLQRQLEQLKRELRAQKARTTQPSSEGSKPVPASPADLSSIELDPETKKDIEEMREVDPVLAKTMERVAKMAIYTANSRAEHVVDTFTKAEQEEAETRHLMEQKAILAQKVPQHDQIFQSREWSEWKETLTPGQRAMAESSWASDVEQAIYAFAAEMRRRNGVQESAAGNTNPPQDSAVRKARQEKVKTSPAVKPTTAKHSEEFDADKAFMEMYNNIATANHIIK